MARHLFIASIFVFGLQQLSNADTSFKPYASTHPLVRGAFASSSSSVKSADFMTARADEIDPRCPATFDMDHSCPSRALAKGLIDLTRSADPTSCDKLGDCPKCLVGPEWEARLRDELKLGTADRSGVRPWVLFRNWYSHELLSTIAMIILREALGYDAYGKSGTNRGNIDMICCGPDEVMMELERWSEGTGFPNIHLDEDGYFTTAFSPVGYAASSNLYIPEYTLKAFPLANAYNAYKYLPEYSNIFSKSFSTRCEDMLVDQSAESIASCNTSTPKYVCETNNHWEHTTCVKGHYVPPQCEGENAVYCQEIYHTDPEMDSGRFEGIIRINKLNFTVAYIANYAEFLMAKHARGEHFMFYWAHPDPLVSAFNSRPVIFDPHTDSCERGGTQDPTTSMAGCAYMQTTLLKVMRRDVLRKHPDLKQFLDGFSISDDLIAQLLAKHTLAGGTQNVFNISCDYIKNNYNTWSKWVQQTPTEVDTPILIPTSDSGFPMWVVGVIVALAVLIIIALAVAYIFHQRFLNRHAPKQGPLALLFTDVAASTSLWELCGADMKRAMGQHNSIIRNLIAEYEAYEVKTNGDSFMIACKSLTDATLLSLAIQNSLNECKDVPKSIAATYAQLLLGGAAGAAAAAAAAEDAPEWHGLRVRIALHWCAEVSPQLDSITGRYDYFGHDVNVCARVESYAQGGQVLVEESTHLAMTRNEDLMDLLTCDGALMTLVAKAVELKGVQERVSLYSIVPASLARRQFKAIQDAGDGMMMANKGLAFASTEKEDSSDRKSTDGASVNGSAGRSSQTNAAFNPATSVRFTFAFLLNSFASDESRKAWLTAAAAKHNVPTTYNVGRMSRMLQSIALKGFNAMQGAPAAPTTTTTTQHGTSKHTPSITNTAATSRDGIQNVQQHRTSNGGGGRKGGADTVASIAAALEISKPFAGLSQGGDDGGGGGISLPGHLLEASSDPEGMNGNKYTMLEDSRGSLP